MSRKEFGALSCRCADWLLVGLFVWSGFQYRSGYQAELGSGFVYFFLAGSLGAWSSYGRHNRATLIGAYLALWIGWLNYLAAPNHSADFSGGYWLFAAIVGSAVYGYLLRLLLWIPAFAAVRSSWSEAIRPLVSRLAIGSATALGISMTITLLPAMQDHIALAQGEQPWLNWTPFQYAMLFAALAPFLLALALLSAPWAATLKLVDALRVLGVLGGALAVTGLVEYATRGNWHLYCLSSMALSGVFLAYWRMDAWLTLALGNPTSGT